ncbi:hypothetical protein CTEN210_04328 [Chaetoceros tenuissimus]|uniref:Leucine-rich repeat domain-containing protein n=1 Tax=Chaetoceros tenuissimus TaxID=426638 RepID=A0AAD3H264_9STRA|nr:hypothetical protein CTEN210_04328 [Chaetoceros tenuissimus]
MRVQTEEWRRFVPGVRMYKGKKTLFYNGEKLWDIYSPEDKRTWEVVIILPGVEYKESKKLLLRAAILVHIKLSRNLEYIGEEAFMYCESLTSIFIPESCEEIGNHAFYKCTKLIILSVDLDGIYLGDYVIAKTKLKKALRPLIFFYTLHMRTEINMRIENINADEQFKLHRICSSCDPCEEDIQSIVKQKALCSLQEPNAIGITPIEYLVANPFADIDQNMLLKRYVLGMMGEKTSMKMT